MENSHKNVQSIADIHLKMWDFSNFCIEIHDAIGCQKPSFELKIYCDVLSEFLKRVDKLMMKKDSFLFIIVKFLDRRFLSCIKFT